MFCINVWLTVQDPTNVARVRDLLAQAGRLSREENGCLQFEVFHSQDDPQRFLLCERWSSQDAWRAHRNERAFREIYQPHVLPLVERQAHICDLVE